MLNQIGDVQTEESAHSGLGAFGRYVAGRVGYLRPVPFSRKFGKPWLF
jgi:hypothetical protein